MNLNSIQFINTNVVIQHEITFCRCLLLQLPLHLLLIFFALICVFLHLKTKIVGGRYSSAKQRSSRLKLNLLISKCVSLVFSKPYKNDSRKTIQNEHDWIANIIKIDKNIEIVDWARCSKDRLYRVHMTRDIDMRLDYNKKKKMQNTNNFYQKFRFDYTRAARSPDESLLYFYFHLEFHLIYGKYITFQITRKLSILFCFSLASFSFLSAS